MPSQSRVKASDVAREAGVSIATVSYVLNDTPGQKISEATATRVRQAAKKLGYVRNRAAQALARGDSRLVVIDISAFPKGPASEEGTKTFNALIESRGFTAIQTWWGPGASEKALIKLVRDTGAARVLSAIHPSPASCEELRSLGVSTISSLLSPTSDSTTALQQATQVQVDYLADAGHKHIMYLPSPNPKLSTLSELRDRTGAARAQQRGISWRAFDPPAECDSFATSLLNAWQNSPEVSALAAFNDELALRALSALSEAAIEVPSQIAVIGAGNFPYSPFTYPPLTTVEYVFDISALPEAALDAMLEGEGKQGIASEFGHAIKVRPVPRGSA